MPRRQILTDAQREKLDSPSVLSSLERKRYFPIPARLAANWATRRTETTQGLWVRRLGYFKAPGRFFARRFHAADVEYAAYVLMNSIPSFTRWHRHIADDRHTA
jgi:hypothetical protein